jgi:hypothetical protein
MPTADNRRRIEIDARLYEYLDREARWLHMSITALASMILAEDLKKRPSRHEPVRFDPPAAGPGITTAWSGPPRPPFGRDDGSSAAALAAAPTVEAESWPPDGRADGSTWESPDWTASE